MLQGVGDVFKEESGGDSGWLVSRLWKSGGSRKGAFIRGGPFNDWGEDKVVRTNFCKKGEAS